MSAINSVVDSFGAQVLSQSSAGFAKVTKELNDGRQERKKADAELERDMQKVEQNRLKDEQKREQFRNMMR